MTTPATIGVKIFLIFYGVIGCVSTILFFNLFLERLITVIAYVMRSCHQQQLRRRGVVTQDNMKAPEKREADSLAVWKPSYHWLWGPAQYESQGLYRFANFFFILMGVCCIYSLFNVISILIKQTVNWILRKLDSGYFPQCQRGLLRSRRNRMMPGNIRNRCNISTETDGMMESDTDGRRLSGEMISMKDTNKVSLAILQKQLSEMANGGPHPSNSSSRDDEFSGGVGAFAVMNNSPSAACKPIHQPHCVLSSSGFGMTTPATIGVKIFLIFYGVIGCVSTILFFNLFLERLITVIAYVMRSCHQQQLRRRGVVTQDNMKAPEKREADSLAVWKPSV
ncbi:Potassium channel subfamily K member 13 [Microtus ochrogaster]|uniref:Potassium channel subfamily K member 13 n=1 Tax=Microtus ochrogaster TaxID=79684 RepID=A0A8J6G5E2_MICOH|nr:Potassium channel subfamily K member 13 [Microtus ochrogaster]